jgi:hypothetical protein
MFPLGDTTKITQLVTLGSYAVKSVDRGRDYALAEGVGPHCLCPAGVMRSGPGRQEPPGASLTTLKPGLKPMGNYATRPANGPDLSQMKA